MTPPDLSRVVVIGTSASGKTTFARRLASTLGSPHVELDALHWGANWTPRPTFRDDVRQAAQQSRWVIDGNYSVVRDVVWPRASAIVWLDYSFARVFTRALRRTVGRVVAHERLYGGNRETIASAFFDRDGIPWYVLRSYGRRRREFPALLARPEYTHATVIRLRAPAAAEAFLAQTPVSSTSPPR